MPKRNRDDAYVFVNTSLEVCGGHIVSACMPWVLFILRERLLFVYISGRAKPQVKTDS